MASERKHVSEWKSLYQKALEEPRPAFAFRAIHEATKAMARQLHELGPKDSGERKAILVGLSDLRVLRIVFIRASGMFI